MKAQKQTAKEKFASAEQKDMTYWSMKIRKAIDLEDEIKELKQELDRIKEDIRTYFGEHKSENRLVTPAGAAILKITNSYSIKPDSIPELKKIYGESYPAFVNEKISHSPTAALRKLLADGDYKYADIIRNAVEITTSYSVQFDKGIVKA